jgi:hypothetical protein
VRKESFKYFTRVIPFLMLFFLSSILFAQEPVFVAKASGNRVAQHSVFSVQFELKNASWTEFQPPSFSDTRIVGGPASSSSTMIVNGVVSKSQSWTYSLVASKIGKLTIGPATVVFNGQTYQTKPITIEVIAPSEMAQQEYATDTKDPVFLRAELNDSIYYPGQQIIITYKLLFRENVQTVNHIAEDDYADFFVQHLHFYNLNPLAEYEMINGVQYTSKVVKSIALYAHQSGTYEIDPLIMNAGINAPFEANRGFFSMRRVQNVQVASSPVTIRVEPLPADVPDSFSGAVGQYQMRVSPGRQRISTNDAFTFHLEITGNGDSRRWGLPAPQTNGEFDVYEPKILSDEEFEMNEQMNQRKKIAYQMIPASPGEYAVTIPFTYFDPLTKSFETIHSDTMVVSVVQGQQRNLTSRTDEADSFGPELMSVRRPWFRDKFWLSFPHLLLFGLIISGTGIGFMRIWRYEREQHIPEAQRISRDAGQKANQKLNALEKGADEMSANVFFETATEIFYSFLIERFTIPSSKLDEAGLALYLKKSNISESVADRVKIFFSQCLSVRYGGTPGGFSRAEMIAVSRELINALQP